MTASTDAKLLWNKRMILAALEAAYGDATEPDGADALEIFDLGPPTVAGGQVEHRPIRPYLGATKKTAVNVHQTANFWMAAAGAGTAGTAPGFDVPMQMAGFARSTTTGEATLQNSPGTPAEGNTGTLTYVKGDPYAGTVDRVVTLTCTTPGGSGVAEVTVSSPATRGADAYNQAGVVITDAQPLALPGGATITPTIGDALDAGDSWTIQLLAPAAEYNPVSGSFASGKLYYVLDNQLHAFGGARAKWGCSFVAAEIPKFTFDVVALWAAPAGAPAVTPDWSRFTEPLPVSTANTPWFRLDGQDLVLQSLTIENSVGPVHRERINQKRVEIGDRPYSGKATFDLPQRGTWDAFAKGVANEIVAMELTHGTATGRIVGVDAPRVQLANPVIGQDAQTGIATVTMDLSFLPTDAGNDELIIFAR